MLKRVCCNSSADESLILVDDIHLSYNFFLFSQIFPGNYEPDEEALTVFEPPLFGRYLRIHPRGWINDIALRMEVLGCNTQEEH